MKKSLIILIEIILLIACIHAKAPDMEIFVPTEYMYMTQLDKKETENFIKDNESIFEMCQEINLDHLQGLGSPEQTLCLEETKVYKETVNGDTFYWILVPGNRMDDTKEMMRNVSWVSEKHYFLGLVRVENGENKLLMFYPTLNIYGYGYYDYYYVRTYQIIKGKDKNKGIILYENKLPFYRKDAKFDKYQERKNQPVGVIERAGYYLFENEPQDQEYFDDRPGFVLKNWPRIMINASDFLWDLKDPMKYGLQNAFDANPATSYVENTEDDLMMIKVYYGPLTKYSIINGYAKDKNLYMSNNRIIEIADEWIEDSDFPQEELTDKNEKFKLKDNSLNYQIINLKDAEVKFTNGYFYVSKIQKGKKYNDTCLAELNFYGNGFWLFNDIDE